MPAPKGNEFWKLRTTHGVEALFTVPKKLWEACVEYFQWCEDNPLIETDFRGKDATKVDLPKMRAFTIHGLCLYLGVNTKYFNDFKGSETAKREGFAEVLTRISDTIYNQKFTGAAAGFLNPNIIARDLGLRDGQDVKHEGLPDPNITVNIVNPKE